MGTCLRWPRVWRGLILTERCEMRAGARSIVRTLHDARSIGGFISIVRTLHDAGNTDRFISNGSKTKKLSQRKFPPAQSWRRNKVWMIGSELWSGLAHCFTSMGPRHSTK